MSREPFSALVQRQREAECGPTSLSAALFLMGVDADPDQVMRVARVRRSEVRKHGFNDEQLTRVARTYGATVRRVAVLKKEWGEGFAGRLQRSLEKGKVALLLVRDFEHWVLVVGFVDGFFVIMDPDDKVQVFNRWNATTLVTRAWNEVDEDELELEEGAEAEPPQYFALVLGSRRGRFLWQPSKEFLRLCERGADATADQLYDDLVGIASHPQHNRPRRGPLLHQVLERNRDLVVDAVDTWAAGIKAGRREVRELYQAYCTVAAATGLRLQAGVDEKTILARITALMTAYRFYGPAFA